MQEGLIFEVLNDEFHADLLFWVSELVKEEGWLKSESLPTILGEAIDLSFGVSYYEMVVETGVLSWRLHEGVGLVQTTDKPDEGQITLQVRDRLHQDVTGDYVAILVLGNDHTLLLQDLCLGSLKVILQETVVIVR